MTGHVFVIRGDIKLLRCDAWMLPTDGHFQVSESWNDAVDRDDRGRLVADPWQPTERARHSPVEKHPNLWIARTAPTTERLDWEQARDFHLEGVEAFVRHAAAAAKARPENRDRKISLAVPLVGTGAGGMSGRRGVMLEAWFRLLHRLARAHRVDIVTVCWTAKDYAAAQRARAEAISNDPGFEPVTHLDETVVGWDFGTRTESLHRHAKRLAALCSTEHLALFLGAGVSAGAGLPTWMGLLQKLDDSLESNALGIRDEKRLRQTFDPRDLAALLERRFEEQFGGSSGFNDAVAAELQPPQHSLQHALIAALPTREIITTNFDELFELAAKAGEGSLSVLPGTPVAGSDRWLLKIHGTVSNPPSMVFTRSNYLSAPRDWGALFGLVQAMLLTRHMLFLGYSLSDEDFHEVVHEVRLALPPGEYPKPLGTAITLFEDPVLKELWKKDVDVISVADGPGDDPAAIERAARDVARFLDLVGFLAADTAAFVLDGSYADMLNADERALSELLDRVADSIPPEATGPGWEHLRILLRRLGRDEAEPSTP